MLRDDTDQPICNCQSPQLKMTAQSILLHIKLASICLACLMPVSAIAQPDDFQRLSMASMRAEARGDWDQALRLCHQMLEIKPGDIGTMVALSGLYGHAGNPAAQISWAQKVLAIQPKNFNARVNLGNGSAVMGWDRAATEAYLAAEALDPNSPIPAFSLGVLAQSRGRDKDAINYFRKSLKLSPDFEDAQFNLAVSLANLGQGRQALAVLDQLLQQNPSAEDARQLRREISRQKRN